MISIKMKTFIMNPNVLFKKSVSTKIFKQQLIKYSRMYFETLKSIFIRIVILW